MADFRRLLYVFAVVAFLASFAIPAHAQFTCNNFNAVNVPARAEGYTELVGDITFNCSANGQPPTEPGKSIPSVNITVSANTNITSRILAISPTKFTQYNEALLIIDEPNTTRWTATGGRPISNCGANGEDSGPDGPGVCAIIAPTNPNLAYDGSVGVRNNGAGNDFAACPSSTTYGCGRPNVFQGRNAASLISGQFNAIQFLEVPFDPPNTNNNRSIRITNIRVDATRFGVSSPFSTVPVTATVSFGGGTTISVPDTTVTVAQVQQGMTSTVYNASGFLQCVGTDQGDNNKNNPFFRGVNGASPTGSPSPAAAGGGMDIRVAENFGTAWKVKNLAGLLANGTLTNGIYAYTAGTNALNGSQIAPTVDNAQNVPGAVYNTESGFEYNASTLVPGPPNPPTGFGVGTVPNVGNPLFSPPGPLGTNIQAAGRATQGTRISVQVSTPLPNGSLLFFPIVVPIFNQSNGLQTGVMVADALVDQNGFGAPFLAPSPTAFSFVPSGGGAAVAIPNSSTSAANSNFVQITAAAPVITYEVLFSQAGALEFADIVPAVVYNNNGLSTNLPQTGLTVTATTSFAPIASGLANPNRPQQDGFYATPRFTSGFKTPADPLFTISKCACDLLFPWVVSAGTIDTGIVVANTSLDPCGGNTSCTLPFTGPNQATPQVGAVTFYYFGTVGVGDHNAVANLAPNTSLPVIAGGYVAHVLSQNTTATNGLGSRTNFAGYVIAQADFQYCHGVVDITQGAGVIFNYVGLQLDQFNLFRTNQVGETLGH
jgi:hypothetical protein